MNEGQALMRESAPASIGRTSGIVLACGSITMLVFMAMHPSPHAHDSNGLISELAAGAVFNGTVHGVLMGTLAVVLLGMVGFAEQLGLRRIIVRGGLTAYAIGVVALIGAATVNGFIVPAVAARYAGDDPGVLDRIRALLVLCHEMNQACDHLGIVALSAAALLWSLELLRRGGASRAIGVLGLICGLLPPAALFAGRLPMNVHGFGGFVLLQTIWYLAIAVQLIRGRIKSTAC